MKNTSLLTYAAAHFLVDFACGYILYAMFTEGEITAATAAGIFLLYNLLAFGTQFIFGAISDKLRSNGRLFAVIGIVATAIGLFIGSENVDLTVCLVGLGNACFHVGGGTDSICEGRGMTRAGIFVSTGALGVAFGCKFGEKLLFPKAFYIIALVFMAVIDFMRAFGKEAGIFQIPPHEASFRQRYLGDVSVVLDLLLDVSGYREAVIDDIAPFGFGQFRQGVPHLGVIEIAHFLLYFVSL